MSTVAIGAGSNLGAREAAIATAAVLLDARPGIEVVEVSPLYETPPLGPPQDDYLNAAFLLDTELSPPELLDALLRIERRLGRRRRANQRWGPRSIDLDILWDSRGPFHSTDLQVPHRELERRNFALGPLLDVAPELDEQYRDALALEGGRPALWSGVSVVEERESSSLVRRTVEGASLVDACAASVRMVRSNPRPWSTLHVSMPAELDAFAQTVRRLFRSGFQCCCTTMSHCSQAQWNVEFHGACTGLTLDADVRLEPRSGAADAPRVTFVATLPGNK
jgi:2-amino-4-hydroxy-6-hydroxymethyldihydropteridine diphosphokinase